MSAQRIALPRMSGPAVLRRLVAGDLRAFQSYRHDADVGRWQGWQPMTDAVALEFLNEMNATPLLQPGQWTQLAIVVAGADNTLCGDIGLFVAADGAQGEIGFTLAASAQGRGLGSAAVRGAIDLLFEFTTVARVIAITDARNAPSIRLLERIGMARIATRDAIFRGDPCIEHTYAVDRR